MLCRCVCVCFSFNTEKRPLTDGVHKVAEGAVREERLRKFPEEHLQSTGGDVDVLPLTVAQIHLLI